MPKGAELPKVVQLIPLMNEASGPWAFYGVDAAGRVWFGVPHREGAKDGGPDSIKWRLIQAE